jgi:hypothetical protein
MAAVIFAQSVRSSRVVSAGIPGTPAVWVSTCRNVAFSLPRAPNSGQNSTIGVS